MYQYPFSLIAGKNLGTTTSSLHTFGNILPSRTLGQASVRTFLNAVTGNLCVFDHLIVANENCGSFIDKPGRIPFRFIYNSQGGTSGVWRLAIKNLTPPDDSLDHSSDTLTVTMEDGCIVTFTYDSKTDTYYSTPTADGILQVKQHAYGWSLFNPKTQMTTQFREDGKLIAEVDVQFRSVKYTYDPNNEDLLVGCFGDSGTQYQFVYGDSPSGTITLQMVNGTETTTLQTWTFNQHNQLLSTVVGSGENTYTITYTYVSSTSNLIKTITQDDQTTIAFSYEGDRVTGIQCGTADLHDFTEIEYTSTTETVITDAMEQVTQIAINADHQLQSVTRHSYIPYTQNTDTISVEYNANEQIETITFPDQGTNTFTYDETGLIEQTTRACGQVTQTYRDQTTGLVFARSQLYSRTNQSVTLKNESVILSAAKDLPDDAQDSYNEVLRYAQNDMTTPYTTRYIYDTSNPNVTLLRFTISPMGAVTEYRYDDPTSNKNCSSKRTYTQNFFPTNDYPIDAEISLDALTAWAAQQDPTQVSLNSYSYNTRGQISEHATYAEVDQSGNGITNGPAGCSTLNSYFRAYSGQVRMTTTLISDNDTSIYRVNEQYYDELYRPTESIIGANSTQAQTTNRTYLDGTDQCMTTLPDGQEALITRDTRGLIQSTEQISITGQTRDTENQRDALGRAVVHKHFDGQRSFTFYDQMNRPICTVDPCGHVSWTYITDAANMRMVTRYANAISLDDLQPDPDIMPTINDVAALITYDNTKDRTTTLIFDDSGRERFVVDSEHYAIEKRYDTLDEPTDLICYKNALTDAQFVSLMEGNLSILTPNVADDRWEQTFYDPDGHKIGFVDAAGYVTQWIRDAAGRVVEKITFFNPITQTVRDTNDFYTIVDGLANEQDGHHYYQWNARDLCTAEIDEEGYLTTHTFTATNKALQTIRYATRVTGADPSREPRMKRAARNKRVASSAARDLFTPPPANSEDRKTSYLYDDLDRLIQKDLPFGLREQYTLDNMNRVTLTVKTDTQDATQKPRATATQYDDWGQPYLTCPARVATLLLEATTPAEQQTIWDELAAKKTYDDTTGLVLKTTSPLKRETIYYYNEKRQVVLTINGRGAASTMTYNSFGEVEQTTLYTTMLTAEQLATLSGGFITADVTALIQTLSVPDTDIVHKKAYNQRGLVQTSTDPRGFVTTNTFNAFRECEEKIVPVADQAHTMTISKTFENRGLCKTTTTTDGTTTTTESREYQNPLGRCTSHTNANHQKTTYGYDKLGRKTSITNALNAVTRFTVDAFARVTETINALGFLTKNIFNQTDRTVSTKQCGQVSIRPAINSEIATSSRTSSEARAQASACPVRAANDNSPITLSTKTQNAYGDTIETQDGTGTTQTKNTFGEDGQVETQTDALDNTHAFAFDLDGLNVFENTADNTVTIKAYDEARNLELTETLLDDGESAITTHEHDSANRVTETLDPNQNTHKKTYDQSSNLYSETIDPDGLNITKTHNHNALNQTTQTTTSDATHANFRRQAQQIDGMGRNTGKIIDPDHLSIEYTKTLDAMGYIRIKTDPNGKDTFLFYDALNRMRFKVSATGRVEERQYDNDDHITAKIHYTNTIDTSSITEDSTLAEIEALLDPTSTDTATYTFYNSCGNPQYQVNQSGAVVETIYDGAQNPIATINYANPISTSMNDAGSRAECEARAQASASRHFRAGENPDPTPSPNDRTTYCVYDAKGQIRFTIDPQGFVKEKVYDQCGRIIQTTSFANAFTQISELLIQLTAQTPAAAQAWFALQMQAQTSTLDRTMQFVFDKRGLPAYQVNAVGAVTQFIHDNNGNLVQTIEFADTLFPLETDYDRLTLILNTEYKTSTHANDRKHTHQYDAANRKIKTTNGLGFSDEYGYYPTGQLETHTDRNGNTWTTLLDTAGRITQKLSPETTITLTFQDPSDPTQLIFEEIQGQRTTIFALDQAGNQVGIKHAAQESGSSTLLDIIETGFGYDDDHHLTSSTQKDINIDDPSKVASFEELPTTEATLTTNNVYDGKGNCLVHVNENGQPIFHVFDANNKEIFTVNALGYVIVIERNTWGEVTSIITMANPLKNAADLKNYLTTGLPTSIIEENANPDTEKDWVRNFERDHRGHIIELTTSDIAYHSKDKTDSGTPTTNKSINAFGKPTLTQKLISENPNVWENNWVWFDNAGNKVATMNAECYVTLHTHNAFNEIVETTEYATALNLTGTETSREPRTEREARSKWVASSEARDLTFEELYNAVTALPTNIKNRTTQYQYNVVGKPTLKTFLDVELAEEQIFTLTEAQTFDGLDNLISKTDKNGNTCFYYYNDAGQKIAETGVPRTQIVDSTTNPITTQLLVPLTFYGINAHGQTTQKTAFYNGTDKVTEHGALPTPKAIDPTQDQTTLTSFDNRGLKNGTQNPNEYLTLNTHTATQQKGRTFSQLSNPIGPNTELDSTTDDDSGENLECEARAQASAWPVCEANDNAPTKTIDVGDSTYTLFVHIDETRYTYDDIERKVLEQKRRDNIVQANGTTGYRHDGFNNVTGTGPGDGTYPQEARFHGPNKWLEDAKNGIKLTVPDLRGKKTLTLQSGTENIANIQYAGLAELIRESENDINFLCTEQVRDLAGQQTATVAPSFMQSLDMSEQAQLDRKAKNNEPADVPLALPLTVLAADDTLSWDAPVQAHLEAQTVTLAPQGDPTHTTTLPIQTTGTRQGIDLSTLPTDVYTYEINYTNKNTNTNYQSTGTFQINTNDNTDSQNLVVTVNADGSSITLAGNTANITQVQLQQGTTTIATIDWDGESPIDLSQYPSGTYVILSEAKNLPNETSASQTTLPFTIHTPVAANEPMANVINVTDITLSIDETTGTFNATMPARFATDPLTLNINYLDDNEEPATLTIENATPGTPFTFANTPIEITSIDLSITIDGNIIPLLTNTAGTTTSTTTTPSSEAQAKASAWPVREANDNTHTLPLTFTPMPRDGHCLFSSVALHLNESNENNEDLINFRDLRRLVAAHLAYNLDEFRPFLPISDHEIELYLTALRDAKLWPGNVEITILQRLLNRPIIIIRPDAPPTISENVHTFTGEPIFVHYNGSDHYDALTPEDGADPRVILEQLINAQATTSTETATATETSREPRMEREARNKRIAVCEANDNTYHPREANGNYTFPSTQTAIITANQPVDTDTSIFIWTINHDLHAAWNLFNASVINETQGILAVDLSKLPMGLYPCAIAFGLNAKNQLPTSVELTIPITPTGAQAFLSTEVQPTDTETFTPVHLYTPDRWGNKLETTDPKGYTTQQTFNRFNKWLSKVLPATDNVMPDNSTQHTATVLYAGYNRTGALVTSTDGNNNTTITVVDEVNQTIMTILPDGTIPHTSSRDIFSREQKYWDARGECWTNTFDRAHNILTMTPPSLNTNTYAYNQNNKRWLDQNALGESILYAMDPNNNIQTEWLPLGQRTDFVYDRNGQTLSKSNTDGTLTYVRDFFGNALSKTDLSNITTTYTRDFMMRVTCEQDSAPHGNQTAHNFWSQSFSTIETEYPTPPKDLITVYSGTQCLLVTDNANGQLTHYRFDINLNSTSVLEFDNILAQIAYLALYAWDEQDRMIAISSDDYVEIGYGYDPVGNIRFMGSVISTLNADGAVTSTTDSTWSTFDTCSRILIAGGELNGDGVIVIAANKGTAFTYQHDLRATQQVFGGEVGTFTYTPDGAVLEILYPNGAKQDYGYDNAGRFTSSIDYGAPSGDSYTKVTTVLQLNANGWPIINTYDNQTITGSQAGGWQKHTNFGKLSEYSPLYTAFTAEGAPIIIVGDYEWKENWPINQFNSTNSFIGFDSPRVSAITSFVNRFSDNKSTAKIYFNSNGCEISNFNGPMMIGMWQDPEYFDILLFTNGWDGLNHRKIECTLQSTGLDTLPNLSANHTRVIYDPNGNPRSSYQWAIASHQSSHSTSDCMTMPFSQLFPFTGIPTIVMEIAIAQSIKTGYLPIIPSGCQTQDGDTFATISKRYYNGTAAYASVIADYNGKNASGTIPANTYLRLPPEIPQLNNTQISESYALFAETIYAALSPQIKLPPPHTPGFFEVLVEAIVTIVLVIAATVTGNFVLGGILGSSFLATLTTTIAVGAIGDAVSQGVAIAFGFQNKFNWKELGESALTSAFMPNTHLVIPGSIDALLEDLAILAEDLIGAVQTQLVEMLLGLRKHFSFDELGEMVFQALASQSTLAPKSKNIATSITRDVIHSGEDLVADAIFEKGPVTAETVAKELVNNIGSDAAIEGAVVQMVEDGVEDIFMPNHANRDLNQVHLPAPAQTQSNAPGSAASPAGPSMAGNNDYYASSTRAAGAYSAASAAANGGMDPFGNPNAFGQGNYAGSMNAGYGMGSNMGAGLDSSYGFGDTGVGSSFASDSMYAASAAAAGTGFGPSEFGAGAFNSFDEDEFDFGFHANATASAMPRAPQNKNPNPSANPVVNQSVKQTKTPVSSADAINVKPIAKAPQATPSNPGRSKTTAGEAARANAENGTGLGHKILHGAAVINAFDKRIFADAESGVAAFGSFLKHRAITDLHQLEQYPAHNFENFGIGLLNDGIRLIGPALEPIFAPIVGNRFGLSPIPLIPTLSHGQAGTDLAFLMNFAPFAGIEKVFDMGVEAATRFIGRPAMKALTSSASLFGDRAAAQLVMEMSGADLNIASNSQEIFKNENLRFSAGGAARRNSRPLTNLQIKEVRSYAQELGINENGLQFYGYDAPTAYSDLLDVIFVGPDIYPGIGMGSSVIDRLSMRATLAHEYIGHQLSTLAGKDFKPGSLLDEVQASYRAAILAPGLNNVERYQLLKDTVRRLKTSGISVRQFKRAHFNKLYLEQPSEYQPRM